MLKCGSVLQFLDLRSLNIGDYGAQILSHGLRENTTLAYLNLSNNEITA